LTPSAGPTTAPPTEAAPERSTWHVEPVKVFDNLYFVGEKEYSAWAVTTSEGSSSSTPSGTIRWRTRSSAA
jgi:hypothetical protein